MATDEIGDTIKFELSDEQRIRLLEYQKRMGEILNDALTYAQDTKQTEKWAIAFLSALVCVAAGGVVASHVAAAMRVNPVARDLGPEFLTGMILDDFFIQQIEDAALDAYKTVLMPKGQPN